MKILVTGASGFIASAIIEKLLASNHQIIACARSSKNIPVTGELTFHSVDFNDYRNPSAWLPLLDSVDVVVNCAGILRETKTNSYNTIHYEVPKALAAACLEQGVQKFIQISALGTAEDGKFIASKHQFDDDLLEAAVPAVIIRPSVVLSLRGSYGGTSLLRSLAALPYFIFLPEQGNQRIQPILLEDLAALVVETVQQDNLRNTVLYAVGPEILTIKQYLVLLRSWLKLPPARCVRLPASSVSLAVWFGQHLGVGPLGQTMRGMLERGNTGPDNAFADVLQSTGYMPRSVAKTLRESASFVQDRWHARLYLLAPAVWLTLVFVWIMSGLAGFLAAPTDYQTLLQQLYVPADYQRPLVWATSVLDIVLGCALWLRYRVRLVLGLMLCSVLAYTIALGICAPMLWLEPLGSLLKNLLIILLLLMYQVLEDGR